MKHFVKGAWALSILVAVALGASAVAGAAGTGPLSSSDDDDDVAITGASADRAGRVAVAAVGGGTAQRVERDDGGYDVDVKRADGRIVEVDVSGDFKAGGQDVEDRDANGNEIDDDVAITGAAADRAGRVAERFAGGGEAVRVERDDSGYDVDVRGADGRITEVDVSSAFKAIPDDDATDAQGRDLDDDDDDDGDDDD